MKYKLMFKKAYNFSFVILLATTISTFHVQASSDMHSATTKDSTFLGGPGSVISQMKQDDKAKKNDEMIIPDMGFEEKLEKEWGLTFNFDYNMLYQQSNQSYLDNQNAAGGVARFYGIWKPYSLENVSGKLVFKMENRHKIGTDIPPKGLGSEFGYAGLTAVTFSDAGTILTNLYWEQTFNNNHYGFITGIVDVTDYLDVYGLVNIWTDFNDLSFTTNPTMPAPSQGLGAVVYWQFTSNLYVHAGLADANGDPSRPEKSLQSFFSDAEYFKHIEFGWIGSLDKRYSDNIHISLWQVDERKNAQIDDGWGLTFSISRNVNEKWLPFLRGGYAEDGGTIVDRSIEGGFGYKVNERNDYIGFGIGWARASSDVYEIKKRDQYTMELYHRLQPFPKLQVVPSVQYIQNPAYNLDIDDVWIGSIRLRVVF